MSQFADYATAAAFRDVVVSMIDNEVDQIRPAPQYAVVNAVNYASNKAQVTPNGQTTQIVVGMGQNVPATVGGVVRIEGVSGDRFISEVLGGQNSSEYTSPDGTTGRVASYNAPGAMYLSINSQFYNGLTWQRDDTTKSAAMVQLDDTGAVSFFTATAGANPINFGASKFTINANGDQLAGSNVIRDTGGGWIRTYGNTGWYNVDHAGGWYMSDSSFVRSFADLSVYTGGQMRAGYAAMGSWIVGSPYASWGHEAVISTAGSYALLQGDGVTDPNTFLNAMAGGAVFVRQNNLDMARITMSSGLVDFRIPPGIPALAGGVGLVIVPASQQIGMTPSSERYKENIQLLAPDNSGANNPVWKMHPVTFQYSGAIMPNPDDVPTDEVAPSAPECGLIVEELYVIAPDAVALDAENLPFTIKPFPMLGYLVDAVQTLKARLDAYESTSAHGTSSTSGAVVVDSH